MSRLNLNELMSMDADEMLDIVDRDIKERENIKHRRAAREDGYDRNKEIQRKKLNKPKRFDKYSMEE